MAVIPPPIHTTAAMIYEAYEKQADTGLRPHLGASLIGHHCERYLWLTFHWTEIKQFPGRMLRLFETGKLEEKRICENLRMIGCEVWSDDGTSQFRVSALGGHFGGSMDAVIRGYHQAPKQTMPVEMKTHNAKSFKELTEKTVRVAKPMHYSQMMVYAGLAKLDRALYFAVNKDTDDIYTEYLHFDKEEFDRLMARAERVIKATEPPLKISNDPAWWQCKFCDYHAHCHGTAAPLVNCRTCAHSTPGELDTDQTEGQWHCTREYSEIDEHPQTGCRQHRYIPILLQNFAEMTDASEKDNWVKYKNTLTGAEFYNGDLSSHEIRNCQDKRMLGDHGCQDIRRELDASITA